jgi:ParB family chromosome partitioning protein
MSAVLATAVEEQNVPHLALCQPPTAVFHTNHATYRTATFAQMVRSKLNMRRKHSGSLDELAALIASQGLLQNLVGFEQTVDGKPTGIIEIVAGGRRLGAIGINIDNAIFPFDFQIPYLLVPVEEAVAISLAENLGREPMHHADVFDAMMELSMRGASVDDIAVAFGVKPVIVRRRLKLAKVAPRFVQMYRDDQINLDQMSALAISDDHAAQEQAWDSLDTWSRHANNLRRLLTAQQIDVKADRVMRFVGVEAFKKAGGHVVQDLFSESGAGYTSDAALLESLATAKLDKAFKALQKEGLAWVEVHSRMDHADLTEYGRVRQCSRTPTLDEQATLDAIALELQALEQEIDAADEESDDIDALYQKQELLEQQERAILGSLKGPHPADVALAGAVLTVDANGKAVIHRDLIRSIDKAKMEKSIEDDTNGKAGKEKIKQVHSERLTKLLTAHRTVALHAMLMQRPDVALVVLVHGLIRKVFYRYGCGEKIVRVSIDQPALPTEVEAGSAWIAIQAKREQLKASLPDADSTDGLMAWLLQQPQATILDYLAFCTGSAVDAMQQREQPSPAFVEVAQTVALDMRAWWEPSSDNYLSHVSKTRILEVVTQAVSPEAAQPLVIMKKEVLVDAAERVLKGSGWLPTILATSAT